MTTELEVEVLDLRADEVEVRVLACPIPGTCGCARAGARAWVPRQAFATAVRNGECVRLGLARGALLRHALWLYGGPWVGLVLGGVVGASVAHALAVPANVLTAVCALLGCLFGVRRSAHALHADACDESGRT